MTMTQARNANPAYRDSEALYAACEGLFDANPDLAIAEARMCLSDALRWMQEHGHNSNKGFNLINQNTKLAKSSVEGWLQYGIELASGKRSGKVVCGKAVQEKMDCLSLCILMAGNGRFANVLACRQRRTRMLFDNPKMFLSLIYHDLELALFKAKQQGKGLSIRLNVFSDLDWTRIAPWLFKAFPTIEYYDYTKEEDRLFVPEWPENYHTTLSANESMEWDDYAALLSEGWNVAVVFYTPKSTSSNPGIIPSEFRGFPVIDGDTNDLRFQDKAGSVVGLRAKGQALHNKHAATRGRGFVFDTSKL